MKYTWFCLLLISFSVCKVWSKPGDVKTIRTPNNISMVNTEGFNKILENSNPNTKQFLNWIKQNIQNDIRCVDVGIDPMECETKSESNFKTDLQVWDELPNFIKNQWATITIGNNLPKGVKIDLGW